MRVKVLKNYEDKITRDVHLVGDYIQIKSTDFDDRLHSEELKTEIKSPKCRKKAINKNEPKAGEADV